MNKSKVLGILILILGIFSIFLINFKIRGFIVSALAIIFYFIQKKYGITKLGIAGFIIGIIGIFFSLQYLLEYLRIKWLVMVALVFWGIYALLKKFKKIKFKKYFWKRHKKLRIVAIVVSSIIVLYLLIAVTLMINDEINKHKTKECDTKECFVREANYCRNVNLLIDEEIGTLRYVAVDRCQFFKKIEKLQENESQEMKDFLEGKFLACAYQKYEFDENLVYSLIDGIENCQDWYTVGNENATLKERLGELIIFAVE